MTNNAVNSVDPTLQIVSTNSAALITISSSIPYDNTIPQIAEGDAVISLAITPKSATSTLQIKFVSTGEKNTAGSVVFSLFQDATANALTAKAFSVPSGTSVPYDLSHVMTSGTTAATTFYIRAGVSTNPYYVNGLVPPSRIFGGVSGSFLTIVEHL